MHHTDDRVANLERLRSLAGYDLFNPVLAEELGAICRSTAGRLGVPVTAVQAVLNSATATLACSDEEFAAAGGTANELSFCPQVVVTGAPLVIDDLNRHPEHRAHPFVRAGMLGAYAGVPLVLPDGQILGSHCVLNPEPRHFTPQDVAVLTASARDIVAAIDRYALSSDRG